jgi:hypothetical protein
VSTAPRTLDTDAERRAWERLHENLQDHVGTPTAAPAKPAERRTPKRRFLPAPRPSQLYARVSDALERDGRLSATAIKLGLWLVKWARGRHEVDGFIAQIADAIGRKPRMVQYAQRELERCGYVRVEHVRNPKNQGGRGSLNDANIYHLRAPLLAPPAPRRRLPMRGNMGVQNPAPHEGGVKPSLSSSPGSARARQVERGAAGRGATGQPRGTRSDTPAGRARQQEGSPRGAREENRAHPLGTLPAKPP